MAIGFSGSNGGVQEVYKQFVLADVSAGIKKYESLYEKISKEQTDLRDFYQQAIDGLKDLKQEITEGLEGRL